MPIKSIEDRMAEKVDERFDSGKHVILSNVVSFLDEASENYTTEYVDQNGIYPPGTDIMVQEMRDALKKLFRDHNPERDEVVNVIRTRNYNPDVPDDIFN